MNMIIDDWEYHTRMIVDIAKRNGGALVLAYDPHPERTDTPTYGMICDMVREGVAELRRRQNHES